MQLRKILYLSFILINISLGHTIAKDQQQFISKNQWSKYSKNYDFTETYKTPEEKKPNKKFSKRNSENAPTTALKTDSGLLMYLIYGIGILIILGLLGLLINAIMNGVGGKVKKEPLKATLNNIENIEDADLDNLLEDALTEAQFKEAIRIRYLLLLQTLNRLAFILWKKDKTNGTYINEMYNKKGFDLFMQITIAFDRVWYGDKTISKTDYYQLIPLFEQINTIITTNE